LKEDPSTWSRRRLPAGLIRDGEDRAGGGKERRRKRKSRYASEELEDRSRERRGKGADRGMERTPEGDLAELGRARWGWRQRTGYGTRRRGGEVGVVWGSGRGWEVGVIGKWAWWGSGRGGEVGAAGKWAWWGNGGGGEVDAAGKWARWGNGGGGEVGVVGKWDGGKWAWLGSGAVGRSAWWGGRRSGEVGVVGDRRGGEVRVMGRPARWGGGVRWGRRRGGDVGVGMGVGVWDGGGSRTSERASPPPGSARMG
jgi:hypothetical protein